MIVSVWPVVPTLPELARGTMPSGCVVPVPVVKCCIADATEALRQAASARTARR
jgi:hypothetical protein